MLQVFDGMRPFAFEWSGSLHVLRFFFAPTLCCISIGDDVWFTRADWNTHWKPVDANSQLILNG